MMYLHITEIFVSYRLDCLCDTVKFFPGIRNQYHIYTCKEQVLVILPYIVHQRFQGFLFHFLSITDVTCKVIVFITDTLLA